MNLSTSTLSFAGCGFLCIYHAGVCAAIKQYAPQLQFNKMAGASAGSIAAAALVCNVCISQTTSTILKVVSQARSRALGALHPAFNLIEVVRANLNAALPDNAHQLCTGRLLISLTREHDRKNVIISSYESRDDLIQAILCSCFIPYYCGRTPPKYHGEYYLDGGWSDNQPVIDENTITVSPFSGESDICPPDFDSASLFGFHFGGTSIRFTARNIYRLTVCLIPPSTEVCSRICRQGFEDALRFLIKNGVVPCMRCLAFRSNLITMPDGKLSLGHRSRSRNKFLLPSSTSKRGVALDVECENCAENDDQHAVSSVISSLFPQIMQTTLDEASKVDNRLMAYLLSFRMFRWLRLVTAHVKLPFDFLIIMCRNIVSWLSSVKTDWISEQFQLFVNSLLTLVEDQKAMYSARLTGQLAITELDVNHVPIYNDDEPIEQVFNIHLSPEALNELAVLRRHDSIQLFKKQNALKRASLGEMREDVPNPNKPFDALEDAVQYAETHDAVLAYYYMNDNNEVRVCEIFDVNNPQQRHPCHSHIKRELRMLSDYDYRLRYHSQMNCDVEDIDKEQQDNNYSSASSAAATAAADAMILSNQQNTKQLSETDEQLQTSSCSNRPIFTCNGTEDSGFSTAVGSYQISPRSNPTKMVSTKLRQNGTSLLRRHTLDSDYLRRRRQRNNEHSSVTKMNNFSSDSAS